MLEVLFAVGPDMAGAMGRTQLSSQELLAWCQGSQVKLGPDDFEAIRRLSGIWVKSCNEYDLKNVPSPISEELEFAETMKRMMASNLGVTTN